MATVTHTASGTLAVDVAAAADRFSIAAELTPVPALPAAGAIVLSLLLFVGAARRRATSRQ